MEVLQGAHEEEDEIEATVLKRLNEYRRKPMTESEISEGQKLVLEAFQRAPTLGPSTEDARAAPLEPFLLLCGKVLAATVGRGRQLTTALQRLVFPPDHVLSATTLYEKTEATFATIFTLIARASNVATVGRVRGTPIQCVFALGRAMRPVANVREHVRMLEEHTGFALDGAVGASAQRLLLAVFDHSNTDRFALLVVFAVAAERADPIGPHKQTSGVEETTIAHPHGGGAEQRIVLFDSLYFKRDEEAESPWAYLSAEFCGYAYFDRLTHPYDMLGSAGR
jgi:hypothetical protein